jgi:rod shape-determining protein MreD
VIIAIAAVIAMLLAMLHVSAMQYVDILGVTPDLLLVFAACFAVLRRDESLVVVPLAGLMRDLTTNDPLGTSVLGFVPIVLLASIVQVRAMDSRFLSAVAVCFSGSLAYTAITMIVLSVTGQEIQWTDSLVRVALPAAFVNTLCTPVFYLPLNWLTGDGLTAGSLPGRAGTPL